VLPDFRRTSINTQNSQQQQQQQTYIQATIAFDFRQRLYNLISTSAHTSTPTEMEFTIKPAKTKKHGKGAQSAKIVCELTHCPRMLAHCTRWECHQQIDDALQALENEKLALAMSVDGRAEEAKRLVAEIEKECDMEAFGSEPVSSVYAALKASADDRPLIIVCDCPECKQKLGNLEVEIMAKRLAATQDWLAALREYRSQNDLEFLRNQSGQATEYVSRPHLLVERH
jgi:hypothetical protein